MAMNGNVLGKAIADAVCDSGASEDAKAKVTDLWTKVATQIVNHITTNAMVPPGIAVQVAPATGTGATSAPGKIT